ALRGCVPLVRRAAQFSRGLGERDWGSVARPTLALAVATLAMPSHQRLRRDRVTNRSTTAAAGIICVHQFSSGVDETANFVHSFLTYSSSESRVLFQPASMSTA